VPIHRSAISYSNGINVMLLQDARQRGLDLCADAGAALSPVHFESPALKNARLLVPDEQLQLRTANLDGEKFLHAQTRLKYSGSLPGLHLMLQPRLGTW